jgi:two-component system LytT family response regulator
MHLLTALIVDDETGPRENLKLVIDNYCPELKCLATASSALEGKKLVTELSPDVVFLDINMPVLDGFDFLEMLPKRDFMLVFVTAYQEYAIDAIKLNALDYLLKPINTDELKSCVRRLIDYRAEKLRKNEFKPTTKILLPQTFGFTTIEADEIIWLRGEDCYTHIYLRDNKTTTVSRTLKEFEEVLPQSDFFRIHKSHIINLKYFKEFSNLDGGTAILSDGTKLDVSRRRVKEFLQKVKEFVG